MNRANHKHGRVVFVTGANRGIGFGLSLQLASRGDRVVCSYRDRQASSSLLDESKLAPNLSPVKADITIENDLKNVRDYIEDHFGYLDVLINNAGVNIKHEVRINELDWQDVESNFKVNVGGPFLATKLLYPLIKKSRQKKIINLTSEMASIELSGGGATPYRISKAGLNMLTKNHAIAFRPDRVTVVCVNPGWVQTDMGGRNAPLTVQESARKLIQLIDSLTPEDSGKFINLDGETIPY